MSPQEDVKELAASLKRKARESAQKKAKEGHSGSSAGDFGAFLTPEAAATGGKKRSTGDKEAEEGSSKKKRKKAVS